MSSCRLKGNQLAVVEVPDAPLASELMQKIAREFNFSEIVFLQTNSSQEKGSYLINIFTPANEMNFAGYPIIGTGHVLFKKLLPGLRDLEDISQNLTIVTNAGPVEISYDLEGGVVLAKVPHDVHVHARGTTRQSILDTQPSLLAHDDAKDIRDSYPVVSIVKGVTYTLVDFTDSPELFAAVQQPRYRARRWVGTFITGVMYYQKVGEPSPGIRGKTWSQKLRIRMIAINWRIPHVAVVQVRCAHTLR